MFQALRYLLSNYQKAGIKHKCIIMLTINTIMSALLANMLCCVCDVCVVVGGYFHMHTRDTFSLPDLNVIFSQQKDEMG